MVFLHESSYVPFFLAITILEFAWEFYLSNRQLKCDRDKVAPPELALAGIEDETFQKAQIYNEDKRVFSMACSVLNTVFSIVSVLYFNQLVWSFVLTHYTSDYMTNEYSVSILFTILTGLVGLPLETCISWYSTFVIEDRHGFNKQTQSLFVSDLLKNQVLSMVLILLFVPIGIVFVRHTEYFYIYLWVVAQISIVGMMWLYPNIIAPMFNKYEPLKSEELREKIEKMAEANKFPLTKVYEVDGSKRSAHSNAYMYGFGKSKRIVLFDTLLKLDHEEIVAVLCHELGHWKYSHVLQMLSFISVYLLCTFYLFAQARSESFYVLRAFGWSIAPEGIPVVLEMQYIFLLLAPLAKLFGTFQVLLTRRNEFQADGFAVEQGYGPELCTALSNVHKDNLGAMSSDWLYSWFHHTHPPTIERLRFIKNLLKKE